MSERKKQIFLEAIKKAKKESVMGKLANGDTDPMEPWSKKHAPLDEVNTQVLWKYIKAMGRDPRTIPLADRLNLARTDKFKKFSRDHAKFTDIGESNGDSITEMDKSAPQPGRDGKVSHKTYGSRDNYKLSDPEGTAKPISLKQTQKDALKILKKQGVAESSERADNTYDRLNVWGYHTDDSKTYTNDKGDKFIRFSSSWKHVKSGKTGNGPDELNNFIDSLKKGVAEETIEEGEGIVTPRKTRASFLPAQPGTYAADLAAGKYAKFGFTKSGKETAAAKRERMKKEEVEIEEDWQKVNKSDRTDGLSQKAVNAYRRENPGSKLQTAVTEKNPKGKRAARRKSFCSRMSGMKKRLTSSENARDPDSPINKALRRWNC